MLLGDIFKSIDQKEKRFLLLLSLVVVLITALPYLFGYLITPANTSYTGIHALTPGDFNVYYSYIEQAKQGNFVFQDLYTSEKQDFPLIKPFWSAVGIFARIFNLPSWLAVQLSRLLLIPIFIFGAYLFISYLFSEKQKRKIALLFLVFASGFGAISSMILEPGKYIVNGYYHWPMDLWVPEAISFLSLYHLPHILASSILFILVFLLVLLAFENNLYRYSLGAGIASLFWLWFHPFHFFTVFSVLVIYIFVLSIKRKKIQFSHLKHFLLVLLLALPAVIYHFLILRIDPIAGARAVQNVLLTPAPWLLLISYGALGILALIGFFLFWKEKKEKYLFIAIWFMVQLFLLYAPIIFQRRLSQNFHFPVVILAVAALFFLYQFFSKKLSSGWRNQLLKNNILLWFLFVILFAFSNIFIVLSDILLYTNQSYPYFYLSDEYRQALSWLKNNAQKDEIVFSEWINGNFIPGNTGRKVYVGHGVETVNYKNKQDDVKWFFAEDKEDSRKKEFLKEKDITYLFYSKQEKELGNFNPENKNYLQEVFKNQTVTIYALVGD